VSPVKTTTPVSRGKKAGVAKKSTPVRSQYFDHSDEAEDDIDSEGEEERVEVVKPRRTTARTKGRA
jgi:hypothetical protein